MRTSHGASRCFLVLSVAVLSGTAARAQYSQHTFGTMTQEAPRGVIERTDESLMTVGVRQDSAGLLRAYASRHSADGSLIWGRDYVESQPSLAWSIAEAENGDMVIAGQTMATIPSLRLALTRLTAGGNVVWGAAYESDAFQAGDVFTGVRRNVAIERVPGTGFGVVTSETHPNFPGLTRGRILLASSNGPPVFQKAYMSSMTSPPTGVTFNDIRLDTVSPNPGFLVTGTVQIDPLPGAGGGPRYEALLARFDLAGNPIAAFSYRFAGDAGNGGADIFGDGIEVMPEGDVVISGRTNYFDAQAADAALLRVNLGGGVVWSRAVSGIGPSAAAMSVSDERTIAVAGYTDHAGTAIGSVGLLGIEPTGDLAFSRVFTQPNAGLQSLGRDQVWIGGAFAGWAIAGDEVEPNTQGLSDVALVRTDMHARTGCFERRVPAAVAQPEVEIRPISLIQISGDAWTFRPVTAVDPMLAEKVQCSGGCVCPGDANGDGIVEFADNTAVLSNWGAVYAPGSGPGDADCNGIVNFADVTAVLVYWGVSCP